MGTVIAHILRTILTVSGLVIFAWFLIPACATGTFHIGTWTGMIIGLIFTVYGIFAPQVNSFIGNIWKHIAGKIVLIIIMLAVAAILVLAALTTTCMIRGRNKAPEANATVIVLGCRVYDDHLSITLKARLDAALEYLEENPESACIVSGGMGDNETRTEASAMYEYLVSRGIDPSRIYIEDRSTDTHENLEYSKEIIEREGLNENCAIVTSDFHVYRALKISEKYGYEDAGGIPAETLWWLFPTNYVREMYGILEMWFLK